MDLQEGTGGLRVLGNLRRNPIQAIRSINESMKPYYRNIIGPVNRIGRQFMSWASVFPSIWCLIKILIDPFYRYTSRINYDKKCVAVDDNSSQLVLGFISTVMYFVGLLVCAVKRRRFEAIVWSILLFLNWGPGSAHSAVNLVNLDILKVVFPGLGAINFGFVVVLLLQYLARFIIIYVTFTRATRTSATIWGKAAFNLLLYMLGGHVFGGLWYFFATVRVIDCWTKAGKKYALKFRKDAFVCRGTLRDYNFLTEFCSAKTQNRAIYDFGIYRDALESGIVETTNLPKKILYCFRWGLQNLRYSMGNHLCSSSVQVTEIQSFLQRLSLQSAFGQSLQASTDTWENIFVISITIYSMLLFVFFIGNVQVYLQSEMIRQKKRVDFEFLRNLPEELRKNVKRKLCLEFLKKVDEFRSCEQLLEELCDCVKLVSHDQHTVIVQKGRSIDHMLFLVQGELQTYSLTSVDSAGSTANPPSNLPISIERLEKGEFYGKELVDLFQADLNPSNLPISTRTIQTITKVDAFALMSYDLQNVFIKHRTQVQAPLPADSQPQAPPPPAEPPVQQPASRI